jgi:hypothetical protein
MTNNFTIEDIHKIREKSYDEKKELTYDEIISLTEANAQDFKDLLKKHSFGKTA